MPATQETFGRPPIYQDIVGLRTFWDSQDVLRQSDFDPAFSWVIRFDELLCMESMLFVLP